MCRKQVRASLDISFYPCRNSLCDSGSVRTDLCRVLDGSKIESFEPILIEIERGPSRQILQNLSASSLGNQPFTWSHILCFSFLHYFLLAMASEGVGGQVLGRNISGHSFRLLVCSPC